MWCVDNKFSIRVMGVVTGLHVKGSQVLKAVSKLGKEAYLVQ